MHLGRMCEHGSGSALVRGRPLAPAGCRLKEGWPGRPAKLRREGRCQTQTRAHSRGAAIQPRRARIWRAPQARDGHGERTCVSAQARTGGKPGVDSRSCRVELAEWGVCGVATLPWVGRGHGRGHDCGRGHGCGRRRGRDIVSVCDSAWTAPPAWTAPRPRRGD